MPDRLPTHTGPFALGTFAADGFGAFPGLVVGRRVRSLSDLAPSVRAVVEDWDALFPAWNSSPSSRTTAGTTSPTSASSPPSNPARSCRAAPTTANT